MLLRLERRGSDLICTNWCLVSIESYTALGNMYDFNFLELRVLTRRKDIRTSEPAYAL